MVIEHCSGSLQLNLTPDLSFIYTFHFIWHIYLSLDNTTDTLKEMRSESLTHFQKYTVHQVATIHIWQELL